MKTAYFGWEAANMNGNVVVWAVTVQNPITVVGYAINAAMMATSSPGLFQSGKSAEVLMQAAFGATDLNADFSAPVLMSGVGGNPIQNGVFATAILKTWVGGPPTASAVNDIITQSGLQIVVPAGSKFSMLAGHLGYPMDFEVQGILYYV